MPRILGIDPGSQITGYGIIDVRGSHSRHVEHGCIRTNSQQALPQRLQIIFESVVALIEQFEPSEFAIERVFMHRNADAALKLGQARGVAICAAARAELAIAEYAPRSIKQAVVGKGSADKAQVQHMVRALLGIAESPQADAADALAVALCHGHTQATSQRVGVPAALLARRR